MYEVGCHLVTAHLLCCACCVTGQSFAHSSQVVTGLPKFRVTAIPFRVGFTTSKGMQENPVLIRTPCGRPSPSSVPLRRPVRARPGPRSFRFQASRVWRPRLPIPKPHPPALRAAAHDALPQNADCRRPRTAESGCELKSTLPTWNRHVPSSTPAGFFAVVFGYIVLPSHRTGHSFGDDSGLHHRVAFISVNVTT